MAANPCSVVDALARMQYDIIRRINRKFESLRRIAQLLQDLGNLSDLVPNINALIPVVDIDFDTYNQLAAACPFLNLPFPGDASLAQLRSKVIAAYANLMKGVLNHPWARMGKLQDELNQFASRVNFALGMGASYIECLQAACNAVSAVGSAFEKVAQADIQKELTKFGTGYMASAGQVLNEPMQLKYSEAVATRNELVNLGVDFQGDYNTVAASAANPPIPAPVVETSHGVEYTNPPFVPPPA